MRRYYLAAAALLGLAVIVGSTEVAWSRPLPAHHVVAGFGSGHCLPSGVWQATLTVSADVAGGSAHLQPQGVTGFDRAMPVSNQFSIGPNVATYTVVVTVSWSSDGFIAPPITVTATRPADGCTVPTTSTTDCAHANPPIADCGGSTSLPPTTQAPPATTAPSATTEPTVTTAGSPTTTSPQAPTSRPSVATTICTPAGQPIGPNSNVCGLPTTGSSDTLPLVAGLAAAAIGGVLLVVARRRAA